MEIRDITTEDITDVVQVHMSAFEGFFLTELGARFLCTYYKSVIKSKQGIIIGCFEQGRLCGFAAATTKSRGYNTSLIRNNLLAYIYAAMHIFVTSPQAILRLAKNLSKRDNNSTDKGEYAELLSIAVVPEAQGKNIGRHLLTEIESRVKSIGEYQLSLTTDFYNNDATIKFYNSLGYEKMYDFVAYPKRRMYRFMKHLK